MQLNHIGIWVNDLEKMKEFYSTWFNGKANNMYCNVKNEFESYFILMDGYCKIELMKKKNHNKLLSNEDNLGLAHIAISAGSKEKVDILTKAMKENGIKIIREPRITGDGYYESLISDPEGNEIELVE